MGPDPVLKTYKQVARNGKAPRPSVSAPPARFDEKVRYRDGVELAVTNIEQAEVTARGPGEFTGAPKTRIGLRLTNGSDGAVHVGQVVVTAVYGAARRQASPVYDEHSRDFAGTLEPGKSATAVYGFSIPESELGRVTMMVDFDGRHTVATFEGVPDVARRH